MTSKQKGFSLIEAVVAMVILASSGIAIASWFSLNMQNILRLEDRQKSHIVLDNLYEYFSSIRLKGEVSDQTIKLDGHDIVWSARLLEPIQTGRGISGSVSNFDLGLYEIKFLVSLDGVELGQYRTRRVGFDRVRGFLDDI